MSQKASALTGRVVVDILWKQVLALDFGPTSARPAGAHPQHQQHGPRPRHSPLDYSGVSKTRSTKRREQKEQEEGISETIRGVQDCGGDTYEDLDSIGE